MGESLPAAAPQCRLKQRAGCQGVPAPMQIGFPGSRIQASRTAPGHHSGHSGHSLTALQAQVDVLAVVWLLSQRSGAPPPQRSRCS